MSDKTAMTEHPVHALVSERWSPYAWADRPVEPADLASLFEAARWAASSYNEQPWRWIVAVRDDREAFDRLLSCLVEGNRRWAQHAPILGIGVALTTFSRNGRPNKAAHHDLGLAAANLTLEATARRLHVHQMIGIDPERVRELYDVPDDSEPLTGLAIGYVGDPESLPEDLRERDLTRRTRKPLSELVFAGQWGRPAALAKP
ncbi:MAG: nitroreductase family protein [Myxococcota bacterium]